MAEMRRSTPAMAALLLLLVPLAACQPGAPKRIEAPADPEEAKVPFRLAGPNEAALLVQVHLGEEGPFDFVLDTGATFTCVDEELARRLELPESSTIAGGLGLGGGGRVKMVEIDALRIGDTTAHDLLACSLDLESLRRIPGLEVEGLLGLNFLRSFRVTLDFERRILGLEPI